MGGAESKAENQDVPPQNTNVPSSGNNRSQKDNVDGYDYFASLNQDITTDQYAAFGHSVALRIRDLQSSHAKIMAKYYIGNILCEAELGKYDEINSVLPLSNSSQLKLQLRRNE